MIRELRRELSRGHVLSGSQVAALAQNPESDDVLFLVEGSNTLAEVHLTWSKESDPDWPMTTVYETMHAWLASFDTR